LHCLAALGTADTTGDTRHVSTGDTRDVSLHALHVSASTLGANASTASTPHQPQLGAAGGSRSRKKRVRVGETRESSEEASRQSSRRSSKDASLGACLLSCHRATSARKTTRQARKTGLWSVHLMHAISTATQALEAQLEPCAS